MTDTSNDRHRPPALGAGNPTCGSGVESRSSDRTWPLLITAGLLIVVVVNFAFIWIAVSGADEVTESYVTAER